MGTKRNLSSYKWASHLTNVICRFVAGPKLVFSLLWKTIVHGKQEVIQPQIFHSCLLIHRVEMTVGRKKRRGRDNVAVVCACQVTARQRARFVQHWGNVCASLRFSLFLLPLLLPSLLRYHRRTIKNSNCKKNTNLFNEFLQIERHGFVIKQWRRQERQQFASDCQNLTSLMHEN